MEKFQKALINYRVVITTSSIFQLEHFLCKAIYETLTINNIIVVVGFG